MRIFHRRSSQLRQRFTTSLLATALAFGVACGSDKDDGANGGGSGNGSGNGNATGSGGTNDGSGGDGAGTGSTGGMSSGTGGSGGSGGSTNPNNTACGLASRPGTTGSTPDFEGCTGISMEAEAVAADIFILLDRSTSMGDHRVSSEEDAPTRWEAITGALAEFISAPETANLRVGLQYFPRFETGSGALECSSDGYAAPAVPIDRVTEEHRDALLAEIDSLYPHGLTPAVPAVAGALQYAKEWAEEHQDRPTVLVWAADGFPTECDDTSISTLEDLAEEYGNGTPRVATFVVGLGPVANLKRVADAGGTEAFFVSDCPTAVEDLLAALKRVSSSPTLCEFEVPDPPEGEFIDPDKVNVTFTTSTGATEVVRKVPDADSCSGGGWYFDDPDEPTTIRICPASCGRFGGGSIDIVLGCETISLQ